MNLNKDFMIELGACLKIKEHKRYVLLTEWNRVTRNRTRSEIA